MFDTENPINCVCWRLKAQTVQMEHHALLSILTVPKLKERCRELGIPVGGKKVDLIARIQDSLASSQLALAPTRTSKTATKRKAPIKNSRYMGEQDSKGKRIKSSNISGILGNAPVVAQSSPGGRLSDLTNTTVVDDRATNGVAAINGSVATRGSGMLAEANTSKLLSVSLRSHLQPPRVIISKPKFHDVSRTTARLLPQTFRDPGSIVGCSNANVSPLPSSKPRLTERGLGVLSGAKVLLIPPPKVGNKQIESVPVPTNTPLLQADRIPTQETAILSPIRNKVGQESLGTLLSAKSAAVRGNDGADTVQVTTRRFKGLKLNMDATLSAPGHPKSVSRVAATAEFVYDVKTIYHAHLPTTVNADENTSFLPPVTLGLPRRQDYEILPLIIRNPPRYSFRRQVEGIARVLALTSFHGLSPHASSSLPGDFLKQFSGLSRNYRYASTLAFTHLIRIEFPGKRTDIWFNARRVDEKVADTRPWYWHRVSERAKVIERVRTSWMERVWRFLVLASQLSTSSLGTDVQLGRSGLWFNGVSQHLLADPDLEGQCETAIRFWIRRFYVWVIKNGGGYPQLLHDLREEMVRSIQPLDGNNNQELWRLETRCGGVHFIVGMTGEVVGWVEASGIGKDGLGLVRQRRAKTKINTMIQSKAVARATSCESTVRWGHMKQSNMDHVTWQDLRGDWREYVSALVSSISPSGGTGFPPKSLLETVYRPDSKTVSHGIHESVKLPHHRALAKRWILAQVEPGGISGKPILNPISGRAHKKEKIALDLQAKLTVESIRCSGEKWTSSMAGVLAQGLGFVQTPGMGWFVLEETGQNIAQEDYGIQGLWATVLGVDENGVALSARELEALADMFVWKDT